MDLKLLERREFELRVISELTVELVKLRQNECKHLCIENIGPEIFGKLLYELYPPQPMIECTTSDFSQASGIWARSTADSASAGQKVSE